MENQQIKKQESQISKSISQKKEAVSEKLRKQQRNSRISKNRQQVVENIFSLDNTNGIVSFNKVNEDLDSKNLMVAEEQLQIKQQEINIAIAENVGQILQLFQLEKKINSKQIRLLLQCLQFDQKNKNEQQHPSYSVQFAQIQELILTPQCSKCKYQMSLGRHTKYIENCVWRCNKASCDKSRFSLFFQHNVFNHFRCSFYTMLKLFLQYLPSQALVPEIQRDLGLDKSTITNARKVWQQIVRYHYQKIYKDILLGQDTSVVEVDEACFRRKYNRGRNIRRNQWVFGATEREGGFTRTILIPVASRDKNTLCSLIKQFISPKCTLLITDKWKGYSGLDQLGYQHFTINHSTNFVLPAENKDIENDSDTENDEPFKRNYHKEKGHIIHTQSIENRWTHIKQRLKRLKGQRKNYLNDIFDSQFYLSNRKQLERKSLDILVDFVKSNQSTEQEEEDDNDIEEIEDINQLSLDDNIEDSANGELNIFEFEESNEINNV